MPQNNNLETLFENIIKSLIVTTVLVVCFGITYTSFFRETHIAYSQSPLSESIISTLAKEATVLSGTSGSVSPFGTAGAFADHTFATMRLENFATLSDEGIWSGPDFIIAQSNGRGVFYLQAGGNIYSAGGVNIASGLIRNNLQIGGALSVIGNTTVTGELMATTVIGGLTGDVTSTNRSNFKDITVSGEARIEDLSVLGSFDLGDATLPWVSISTTGSSIRDLADIAVNNPTNDQALLWDSTTSTWKNKTIPTTSVQQEDEADYIISLSNGTCKGFNTSTGETTIQNTNHATCIAAVIEAAGETGVIAFKSGNYTIATELTPKYRQTWHMNKGAVFSPAGNNRILNIETVDEVNILGTLMIVDSEAKSTSVEAIRIEDMAHSYFQHIFIRNYYNGISVSGTAGGTHENTFVDVYLQVRNRGLSLETSCHDNHFIHVWVKGPAPDNWATGPGLYIATGGTQGGNNFDNIELLDMKVGMDLPGAFEAWFGKALVDNPYEQGMIIGGSSERLFFDTIWTASGGDGVVFSGNSVSPADKIQVNRLYSWLNANYGVKFESYVENVSIGMLTVQRNAKGLAFNGIENKDITIDSLTSMENTVFGVDGSGITENVFIDNALIYDDVLGLDSITNIQGTRPGSGLFEARGIATIESGNSSVTVTHGLEGTPSNISLTPYDAEVVGAYVSARTSTTFTVTIGSAVTDDREISWIARSGRQLGDELIANANVESGTTTPSSWNKSASNTSWSTAASRSGSYSLQITTSSSSGDWRSDYVEIGGNKNYRLRGFVKGTGSNAVYLTIRWFSNNDGTGFISEDNIQINGTYSDWTEISADYKAPVNAQSADVLFRTTSATTANIYGDDFSLRNIQ